MRSKTTVTTFIIYRLLPNITVYKNIMGGGLNVVPSLSLSSRANSFITIKKNQL